MIGYRAPSANDPDFAAFLVLQEILGAGSGVSFLQNDWGTPVDEGSPLAGTANDVTTWFPPSAQDYIFTIAGAIAAGGDERATERAIEQRVARLRDDPPDEESLGRAIEEVLDELAFDVQTTEIEFDPDTYSPLPAYKPAATRAQIEQMMAGMIRTEALRPRAIEQSLTSHPPTSAQGFHDLIVTDLRPEVARLAVPLTVLYTDPAGAPLTPAQIDEFYRASYAGASQAVVRRVPDSAHFIMFDAPETFQRELREFLATP